MSVDEADRLNSQMVLDSDVEAENDSKSFCKKQLRLLSQCELSDSLEKKHRMLKQWNNHSNPSSNSNESG